MVIYSELGYKKNVSLYVATLNKNVIVPCLHNVIQWYYQMGLYLESEDEEEDESTDEDE